MRRELREIADEVSLYCGGARVFVLPYPYRGGHFRIYAEAIPELGNDYTAEKRGENWFVTIRNERLFRTLEQMERSVPDAQIRPQKSAFATLLYQILKKDWKMQCMDEPMLVRMALDLDDDAARCRRILQQMELHLGRNYAQALREGRQFSVLTAVARQAVYYMQMYEL